MISDIDLIYQVKEKRDSAAISELVERHTGIYQTVLQQFSSSPKIPLGDLREDNSFNIYNWALKYDPARATQSGKPMQFGSYVGEMTRYMCLEMLGKSKESAELAVSDGATDDDIPEHLERAEITEMMEEEAKKVEDPRFYTIFKMKTRNNGASWRQIASAVGLSHEGTRKLFNRHMREIKGILT